MVRNWICSNTRHTSNLIKNKSARKENQMIIAPLILAPVAITTAKELFTAGSTTAVTIHLWSKKNKK
jgi:hypothetical protein